MSTPPIVPTLPGGDMPITTPTFAGGGVPSSTAAGATPAAPADAVKAMTQRILQTLAQNQQRKQFAGAPVPAAVPGMQDPNAARQIGMNTANPRAWGGQRLMAGISTSIQNAVAQKKDKDLRKAEADWTYMSSALNELYAAQASGNPQAVAEAQSKVDVVMGDPKKLKAMAKALNQDWLNPEKTTVYGEALKKVTAKTEQTESGKQQAAQGIKGLFQRLLQSKQQPQLTPEQQKAMSAEIQAKAPITPASGASLKDQREAALAVLDIEKAGREARENYYPPVMGADGVLRSVNKTNPHDVVTIRDAETGTEVKGTPKAGAAPKVLSAKGVPYGIQRNGKILTPNAEGWTKEDQTALDAAVGATKENQTLRIDPIIAEQVGAPPDPKDYAKGRSDPEYGKALREHGKKAEAIKNEMASAQGIARAKAANEYRPVQVMDNDGNVYYTTAKVAIDQGLSGASEGSKLRPKQAQMKDIETASSMARSAIKALKPGDVTPDQLLKLREAMSEEDEGRAHAIIQNLAANATNDQQQDFWIWINQLNERAMSLRGIAGMGAGAQDLRNAIRAMLPGLKSGSTQMMLKQLDAFDQQVRVLEEGVASPGAGGKGRLVGPGSKTETKKPSADEIQFTPTT